MIIDYNMVYHAVIETTYMTNYIILAKTFLYFNNSIFNSSRNSSLANDMNGQQFFLG